MKIISPRPCRICGEADNPIVASERPCARWYGTLPWMPEDHYTLICCKNCGDLYIDSDVTEDYINMVMAIEIPSLRDTTTYQHSEHDERIRNLELNDNWNLMVKYRKPSRGEQLLDFGSAWGAFGNIAKKSGVIPNGIELQAVGAAFSLNLWNQGRVHQGSIETAPFSAGEFSYISSFETLEHVFDPIRILMELRPLLAKNGIIAISVPSSQYFRLKYWIFKGNPLSPWLMRQFPGKMRDQVVLIHNHLNTFSAKAAAVMMEKAGYKVIHSGGIGSEQKGGLVGATFHFLAKCLWLASFKKILISPSVFIIATHKDGEA